MHTHMSQVQQRLCQVYPRRPDVATAKWPWMPSSQHCESYLSLPLESPRRDLQKLIAAKKLRNFTIQLLSCFSDLNHCACHRAFQQATVRGSFHRCRRLLVLCEDKNMPKKRGIVPVSWTHYWMLLGLLGPSGLLVAIRTIHLQMASNLRFSSSVLPPRRLLV
jgi:hypothetical protein